MNFLDVEGLKSIWNKIDERDAYTQKKFEELKTGSLSKNYLRILNPIVNTGYSIQKNEDWSYTIKTDGKQRSGSGGLILCENVVPAGTWILSGGPKPAGGSGTYYIEYRDIDNEKVLATDYGTVDNKTGEPAEKTFILNSDTTVRVTFIAQGGYSTTKTETEEDEEGEEISKEVEQPIICSPMLRRESDSTYEHYIPNSSELYDMILELTQRVSKLEN